MEQATFVVTVRVSGRDAVTVLDDLVAQGNDGKAGVAVARWLISKCSYTPEYNELAFIVSDCTVTAHMDTE